MGTNIKWVIPEKYRIGDGQQKYRIGDGQQCRRGDAWKTVEYGIGKNVE